MIKRYLFPASALFIVALAALLPFHYVSGQSSGGNKSNASGTVTSVATTSPITGGTFTTSGTIACATCTTSAAALTLNSVLLGGGGQAMSADALLSDSGTALSYTGTGGIQLVKATNASGNGGLSFSGSSLVLRSAATNASIFLQDNAGTNYFNCTNTFCSAAGTLALGFSGGKGQHFNTQAANNDLFGTTSGTTTTATVTFTTNYTSTPVCVITPTTAGVTSAIITTQSNSGFTITYAPSASTSFNYMCGGNPN